MAEKSPQSIDQIIYATCSPDTLLPSTACWLQHKIGADQAWAMDINAACSGFIYGLSTAEKFIQTGQVKTALVLGGEVLSPIINWEDRNSCILFGGRCRCCRCRTGPFRFQTSNSLQPFTLRWESVGFSLCSCRWLEHGSNP